MKKRERFKGLIFLGITLILIFSALILIKNIVLIQIKQRIHSSLNYSQMFFSSFPPSLIIEEVESHSFDPYFSARKISVRLSLKSIISRGKPLKIVIDEPELRLSSFEEEKPSLEKKEKDFTIPLFLETLHLTEGKLTYKSKEFELSSKGIHAVFSQNKSNFSIYSKIKENDLLIKGIDKNIKCNLYLVLNGRGKKVNLTRLSIKGSDGIIKTKGTINDIFQPDMELKTSSFINSSLMADLLKLPFEWEGDIKEKGLFSWRSSGFLYKSEVTSSSIGLNRVPMGEVKGQVRYDNGEGGNIKLSLKKRSQGSGYIEIDFNKKGVQGRVHQVSLQPIANEISIPWPIYSQSWGEFSLIDKELIVNAHFRDSTERTDPYQFPLNGAVRVMWDGKERVLFSSPDIKSSFGDLEVNGELKINHNLDITIKGDIKDLNQAREFTGLVLEKKFEFPEIRGNGDAEIRIFGDYHTPQVKSDFSISQAGFDRLNAQFAKGTIELINNDFFGRFDIEDPSFRGIVGLFTNPNETRVEIRCFKGETSVILPALDLSFPINGEGSGSFEYREENGETKFDGVFSGESIDFAGQSLSKIKGRIEVDDDSIEFPEIDFDLWGGHIQGNLMMNTSKQSFDISLKGQEVDLSSISDSLKGLFSLNIEGKGNLEKDLVFGSYQIENLKFSSFKETGTQGEIKIGYHESHISVQIDGNFIPGENEFLWEMDIPLKRGEISGKVEGSLNNLDLLLPWKGTKGGINYLLNLRTHSGIPEIKGVVDFQGTQMPFPNFAHALENYSGLVFVDSNRFSIRSVRGEIGGGTIEASGEVRLGGSGIDYININAMGDQMLLSILERTRALTNGKLSLTKNEAGFILNGDFFIEKMLWGRELNEEISFSSKAYPSHSQDVGFFDELNLDIHLKADKNAWIENSLGSIQAGFDLTIKGSVYSPVIQGEIEALDGTVYFQDREFNLLQGRVSFFNPGVLDPYISFIGETYVKNYHVTFSLDGSLSNLRPEFNSSPPLPPEDVLALLALGQAFRRTYHYDRSIGQSTASLLSFQLSEEAKKRAEELFRIDRFRIDPFIMGSSAEMTARLTLGKKLSRNFFILYSTNLAAQREDITRIEWELSNDFSIVGTRDETGRISFDVKIHRRF